ncbi:MAG TPA: hypothetical protein VM141_09555 [Planctomycetota bacterium]|nr:hypothetical protein [Planctomycetota bacterium]
MSAKKKTKAKKMGRPPMPAGTQKAIRLSVRVTPAEAAKLEAEAMKRGATVSDLLMEAWRKGKERR